MNTPAPRKSVRLLLAVSLALAVTGVALLNMSRVRGAPQPTAPSTVAAASARAPTGAPAAVAAPSATSPAPVATPVSPPAAHTAPVLPPHGEGLPGDQGIQRALEAAWPADLAAGDERELRAAGAGVLRADATGVGRERWPRLFGARAQVIAPAFGLARFRVQAVIARRCSAPGQAVVHLVWAGTDRGGAFTDGRITDLYFTRTPTRGGSTWTPQPRT